MFSIFIQTNPNNAQGSLSMTDKELSLHSNSILCKASTLVGILSQDFDTWITQEPPVIKMTGVFHAWSRFHKNLLFKVWMQQINCIYECQILTSQGMSSNILSLNYARMIIDRSFNKESPIYMTTNNLSLPSLFSSQMSDLSFSLRM